MSADERIGPRLSVHVPQHATAIEVHPAQHKKSDVCFAWFCAFWLNMSVLWAYQSLVSAQNFYLARFPAANLSFWGTVAVGSAMVIGQALSMALRMDERLGHDMRIVTAYIFFAILGAVVLAAPTPAVILVAFGCSGVLNTLSESPLYDIAALFSEDGRLIGAVNIGNGSAGVLNISLDVCIRLFALATVSSKGGDAEAEHVAHVLFLSLLIATSLSCLPIYWQWTRRIPTFRQRLVAARARQLQRSSPLSAGTRCAPRYARAWRAVRGLALAEAATFSITLLIWPGLPCGAPINGTIFEDHAEWFCSPGVIGTFNFADLFGRWAGTTESVDRALGQDPAGLYAAAGARLLLIPVVTWLSRGGWSAPFLLFAALGVVGFTNGLVGTKCMLRANRLLDAADREHGSRIMVLSLYVGIATGSIIAAVAFGY